MAVFSVVKASELEWAKRLDAEFYKPKYEVLKLLRKFRLYKLSTLAQVSYGTTPEGARFLNSGVPFIKSQNLGFGFVEVSDLVYCDEFFHKRNFRSNVRPKDLLFAAVGETIGKVAVVQNILREANINQNIARVRIKEEFVNILDPFFMFSFFQSKFGQLQILRYVTGNAQPYLNSYQIRLLSVPILSAEIQAFVSNMVTEAERLYNKSLDTYSKAMTFLLQETGLDGYELDFKKTYSIKLFDFINTGRFDAEYYQPAFQEVLDKIKGCGLKLKPLKELILDMKKGIEVGSKNYTHDGKLFIRVSNLSYQGLTDRDQKFISKELYESLLDYKPVLGDLLLTKDATPGIAYVVKEDIEGIISSGILRIKVNEEKIDKEYLALCINSIIGKSQVKRDCGGSVILHWKPDQIRNILIPILPREIQEKIASFMKESYYLRQQAKELLDLSKIAIELAVEEGEDKAIQFLKKVL